MNLDKGIISHRKMIIMIVVFMLGSSIIMGGSTALEQDSWLSLIIGGIISIPTILIYARIIKNFPDKNLYEISLLLFGKFFGKVIIVLMSWYALHLGALVLRNFTEFIQVTSKPETPQVIVMLSIIITTSYLVKSGVETIGRWSLIVFPVVVLVVIITIVLAYKDINIENLFPILNHKPREILFDSYMLFSFPYGEVVLFLTISDSLKKGECPYKSFLYGILITATVLLVVILRNITLLGQEMIKTSLFPSYTAVRIISLGKFLTKVEGIVMINFILLGVSKITIALLAASKGVAALFNIKSYKGIVTPISFLMVVLGVIIYNNTIEMFNFIKLYQIYAIPFQIIIPLIIWIFSEIKVNQNKLTNKQA